MTDFCFVLPRFYGLGSSFFSTPCSVISAQRHIHKSKFHHRWHPFSRVHSCHLKFFSNQTYAIHCNFYLRVSSSGIIIVQTFSLPNFQLKYGEQTISPNQVLLISFSQSIGRHWAEEKAYDHCFHLRMMWRGVPILHHPWVFFTAFPKMLNPLEHSSFL